MAARTDWRGAISWAGQSIFVAAYKGVSAKRPPSFKMLDPDQKLPVAQQLVNSQGEVIERDSCGRGVEVGKAIYPLTDEQLDQIGKVGRSDIVDIDKFPLVSSLPLDLSIETLILVPDDKVPGSEGSVNTLWNGLRLSKRAAVVREWCPRSGARPRTLVIHATDQGLVGNVMPFAHEVHMGDFGFQPTVDKKQGQMFEAGLEVFESDTSEFDLEEYPDTWLTRRQSVIDAAINGNPVNVPTVELESPSAAPDLMAALEKSLADKKKGTTRKAPAKPRARKKAAV